MALDLSFAPFSASLNDRPTAFGIFDNDPGFRADADRVVYFIYRNLGAPILDQEIDLRQIWTAFEEATQMYSQEINAGHAQNVLLDLLGTGTGSLSGSENIYPIMNTTEFARRVTIQYSAEAGTNSPYPTYTASVRLRPGQQRYNLLDALSGTLSGTNITQAVVIRKIHHYEPTAAYRFFDTTSVLNYMNNEFKFESYSPETIFYMLPIWEDVLRGTQLSLNQRVRRSNYSFDIKGYELTLYPTPTNDKDLYFEWNFVKDPNMPDPLHTASSVNNQFQTRGVVSNISNVAFGFLNYSGINSVGKVWIWKMTLALCKEILGLTRSKYGSIPTPSGDITLNGNELIAQGREDKQNLLQELRELLDRLSYKNLMANRSELDELVVKEGLYTPSFIYVSH